MNVGSFLLWGFVATAVLSALMTGAQQLGLSRMSIPYILGTMFSPKRDRALAVGTAVHMLNGLVFAALYAAAFELLGAATWYWGAVGSLIHSAFVLLVVLPVLPGLHPRMASATQGPEPTRGLEPPGTLAFHYGKPTAAATMIAHLAFGLIMGALYSPA